MNIGVHVSLSIPVSWMCMLSSGTAGLYGSSIFCFLRNLYTVLHSGSINLHFHQHCKIILYSPHPHQHLLFVNFFDDGHFDRYEVISHCSFDLQFSNYEKVEHHFMGLLAICMSSLGKCLLRSSTHFLIGLFVFLILSCTSCLYILELNPLSVASFAIISSHFQSCLFILFIVPLTVEKL